MRKFLLLALVSGCFAVSNAPTPKPCLPGEASRYDGSAWQCEALPQMAPPQTCQGGFPVWSGSAWTCGSFPFATATVPDCGGGFPAWSTNGWACTVPAPTSCPGGVPVWSGTQWTCGTLPPDLSGALANPGSLASYFQSQNPDAGIPSPSAGTPGVALSLYGTLPGAPVATTGSATDPGCLTVTHNWNTAAVGYSAWYSDTATGTKVSIPVPTQANLGTTNIALNKPVTAAPVNNTDGNPGLLDDGMNATYTGFATPANVNPTGTTLTVNLGGVYQLSDVQVLVDLSLDTGTGSETWHLTLSDTPDSAGTMIASGTCTPGSPACQTTQSLPQNPSGEFLTWTCDAPFSSTTTNYCLVNELQAYAVAGYFVSEPDMNSVRVCNYSGTTRDLALRVVR